MPDRIAGKKFELTVGAVRKKRGMKRYMRDDELQRFCRSSLTWARVKSMATQDPGNANKTHGDF